MSSNFKRWGGPALILGGLLWVLSYLTEIAIGVTAGEAVYARADPSTSVLVWFWPALFMGAIFSSGWVCSAFEPDSTDAPEFSAL